MLKQIALYRGHELLCHVGDAQQMRGPRDSEHSRRTADMIIQERILESRVRTLNLGLSELRRLEIVKDDVVARLVEVSLSNPEPRRTVAGNDITLSTLHGSVTVKTFVDEETD